MVLNTDYRLWSDTRSSWCNYEVVGEYYRIDNIRCLYPASWNRSGEELHRDVELVPESDNPYDEWAISVRADGLPIGYLSREDAPVWAGVIRRITASGLTAVTDGRIYIYETPDWGDVDGHDNPRMETRARVSIKLGDPELAVPLNNPPTVPYTFLPQSAVVQVTKEDQPVDSRFDYVPPAGRGMLYVTLHEVVAKTARTSKSVVEVRVDNKPVGQLTPQMSQRFLPMIRHLDDRGLVAACQGDITGSSVAAEVRIDAVKANEVDDATLDGPAVTLPALVPALDDPRAYRVPPAYTSDDAVVRTTDSIRNEPTMLPTGAPIGPSAQESPPHRAQQPHRAGETLPPGSRPDREHQALLIAVLLVGGFFAVLIPYVGPIVWLAAWRAAAYLIVQRARIALNLRRYRNEQRERSNRR